MMLKIFSIHDSKAAAHLPPFFLAKEQMAIRTFADCVNDKKHQFGAHPDDYTLFQHGTFDCDTGEFHKQPMISLGNGTLHINSADQGGQIPLLQEVQ